MKVAFGMAQWRAVLSLCRPKQWSKNAFCLAGPLFTTLPLSWGVLPAVLLVFVGFCLASSSVYVLNDLIDIELDRLHPKKRLRALPSGKVSKPAAIALLSLLLAATILVGANCPPNVMVSMMLYFVLNLLYSLWLKHVAILDVFCISLGFLLRLAAGVYAIGDTPTSWIMLCSFFFTLFLGFAKRRGELARLTGEDQMQRPVLANYSVAYLDSLANSSSTMAIVAYGIYTTSVSHEAALAVSILPVVYALFHYKRIVMLGEGGEEPDSLLFRDPVIWLCVALWLGCYFFVRYFQPAILR